MRSMHRLAAVLIAVSLLGAACARRTETKAEPDVATSEPRIQVGHEISFPGSTKPYEVPLDDSLASLRHKPPGTPRFGEYTYITTLPKPVERHAPIYPEAARAKDVVGKVIVHTLVLTDGTVGETWIIQSVPELDEAAAHSVQRWKFTPALDRDKPVAVWVAVPVAFTAEPH